MASFREHVRWIDRLVQESLAWRLRPWKVSCPECPKASRVSGGNRL